MQDILFADDERAVRNSIRAMLEEEGYRVETAKGGKEALALYAAHRPSLILLDVMMPDLNGITVCREIRKSDPVTPILFFTAVPDDLTLVRSLGQGGDDYIEKTCSREELLARISSAMRRRQAIEKTVLLSAKAVRIGDALADFSQMAIRREDGSVAPLTKIEGQILRALSERRGSFVPLETIFDTVYGSDFIGSPSSLRNPICRLRKKLGPSGAAIVNNSNGAYKLK